MTDATSKALLVTLANVHAFADVTFDLDDAIGVLEAADAILVETATLDKKAASHRVRARACS